MIGDKDSSSDLDVEALVDAELRRYEGLASPEQLELFRAMMLGVLLEHPAVTPMVERLRPRVAPMASEEREREGTEIEAATLPLRAFGGER